MEYKKTYTEEDVRSLIAWFKERKDIPAQISLGHGVDIKDSERCIGQLTYLAGRNFANPNFSGPIHLLEQIKQKLESEAGD